MYSMTVSSGNSAFGEALELLEKHGLEVGPRGKKTLECLNVSITIENPYRSMISIRGASLSYYIAEMLWYSSKDRSVRFIGKFSAFWKMLADENNEVVSNYGYWLFGEKQKHNQFARAISLLLLDKYSRQAVMHIKNTENSLANPKDIPCTNSVQFFIRENKLHMTVNMRSNDLVYGFTYDVFYFSLLQIKALEELKSIGYPDLELGCYTHTANSLHIYEKDRKNMPKWYRNYISTVWYDEDRALMTALATRNYIPIVNYAIDRYETAGVAIKCGDPISNSVVLALISKFRPLTEVEIDSLPMMFRKVYENSKTT